jgi:hypothetical protein
MARLAKVLMLSAGLSGYWLSGGIIEARLHVVCLPPRHVYWPSTSPARGHPAAKGGIGCGSGGGQGLQNCSISRRLGLLSARDVLDPAHRAVSGRLWATPASSRPKQADGPMSRAVGTVRFGGFFFSCRQELCGWKKEKKANVALIGVDIVEFL